MRTNQTNIKKRKSAFIVDTDSDDATPAVHSRPSARRAEVATDRKEFESYLDRIRDSGAEVEFPNLDLAKFLEQAQIMKTERDELYEKYHDVKSKINHYKKRSSEATKAEELMREKRDHARQSEQIFQLKWQSRGDEIMTQSIELDKLRRELGSGSEVDSLREKVQKLEAEMKQMDHAVKNGYNTDELTIANKAFKEGVKAGKDESETLMSEAVRSGSKEAKEKDVKISELEICISQLSNEIESLQEAANLTGNGGQNSKAAEDEIKGLRNRCVTASNQAHKFQQELIKAQKELAKFDTEQQEAIATTARKLASLSSRMACGNEFKDVLGKLLELLE
ncbi:hypothetical protein K402DRAFT_462216 [Aulographum hederae CBS 113979]|uniref:Uncharacterized protein n=1 Tax=Aulographum hederae CBS 113979 TaxID=1176131 RepID=A0A6G1H5W3_9PEZI|nr:hypothetical protein K402DRAFT_462216 [Aulographum hederae CBS 113979]